MADTPTNEPLQLRAGDTWAWRREDLSDYPAPTWTLKYALKNASAHIEITATASGTAFAVSVAAATTLNYAAGKYDWVAYVESGSERHSVDQGVLSVLPAFANTTALDGRSDARIIYEALIAAYKTYVASKGLVKKYAIGSRQMEFNSAAELIAQINNWKAEVLKEEAAERMRNGLGTGSLIHVRNAR